MLSVVLGGAYTTGWRHSDSHRGEAPADERFGAYWSQKVQLWWKQFLLIFLRTNAIFCTKASFTSWGGTNSSRGGAL